MIAPVTITGTIILNDTVSPAGRRYSLLGGSATYAALAASRYSPVLLVGAVGTDALGKLTAAFAGRNVDLSGLTVSERPTFREVTVHRDLVGGTTPILSELHCYETWEPVMSATAGAAAICFIGSAPPAIQLKLLAQTHADVIGVDTMVSHLSAQPQDALSVLSQGDILFLNHEEFDLVTKLLAIPSTGSFNVKRARDVLEWADAQLLVLKRGAEGVFMLSRNQTFDLPAVPAAQVRDPSGAGDALAGGILGALGQKPNALHENLPALVAEGLLCASHAISHFGVEGLAQ